MIDLENLLAGIMGIILLVIVTFVFTWGAVESKIRQEAVDKGYATYVIVDKTKGTTQWFWNCDLTKEE